MATTPLCRTCMTDTGELHYMFFEIKIMDRTLPEIIDYVAEVKVNENDELPNYICNDCINLAKSALSFKIQCQRSEAALKMIINESCYTDKSSIKKEHEQCAGDISNYNDYQSKVKVESEQSEGFFRSSKNCQKEKDKEAFVECATETSYSPYQCAVCSYRFSYCSQLEEHVKELHRNFDEESTVNVTDQSAYQTDIITKYSCEMCHKTFSEKRKLLTHTLRCEKRHKDSISDEMIDCENASSNKCDSIVGDDFKTEDSDDDDNFEELIKEKKIKTEPEVLITTAEMYNMDYLSVEEKKKSLHKMNKRNKSLKKNGLMKKSKKRKFAHYADQVIEGAEFFESQSQCDDEMKSSVPYSCTMCERKFRKLLALNLHLKKHEEQMSKVYTCHQCKREFQRKGHLDNHILSHSSEKGYVCGMCPKAFARQESLSMHLANHKGTKKHQCNFCEKGFNVLSTLKDHIRTHTGEKPFLCSICGRGFSQSTNLKEHVRRHQGYKPFKCIHCEQTFVSKGELDAHTRKHSGAHPFVCDVCGGGFTTSSSLVKHKRIHTGERPYQCDFCPMRFTALGTLKNHRRRHTGEKPYKCAYCEKAFAQKNDLVSHTRTHTGERPYVCTVCGHAFRQSSALRTHFKIHGITVAQDMIKIEKTPLKLPETPLTVDDLQIVTLMSTKECVDDSSSVVVTVMTPKSETSH